MDDQNNKVKADEGSSRQITEREAAAWVSHSALLDELFNAIQEDGSALSDDDSEYEGIDDDMYGDQDVYLEYDEEKNRTLELLLEMRPRLAELLSTA